MTSRLFLFLRTVIFCADFTEPVHECLPPLPTTLRSKSRLLRAADYCFTTCSQLEERIKARIEPDFRDTVDLQSQADAFMGIASATIRALVRRVEVDIEPCWREMRNVAWGKMERTADESGYVAEMLR